MVFSSKSKIYEQHAHTFRIAQYLYRAWVTGRVGCDGMMITISTLYRHDFITRLFDMFTNTTDTIVRYVLWF